MISITRDRKSKIQYAVITGQVVRPKKSLAPQSDIGIEKTIQGKEDRDLQKRRYTAAKRIYPSLPEKLHLLHPHLLLVVAYFLLQRFYLRPQSLHLGTTQITAVYQWRSKQPDE